MDGNGRWAKKNFLPKKFGHSKGAEIAEKVLKMCQKYGIEYLTLFAFSIENWNRNQEEINDLMEILRTYLIKTAPKLLKENVKISFIGERDLLHSDIQKLMQDLEEKSKDNKFNLSIAISYGGRDEIRSAAIKMAKSLAEDFVNNPLKNLPEDIFDRFINPEKIPDPDLLIRTSGEYRISNFLLWQMAYTELYFTDKLWPDFEEDDFIKAIEEYSKRNRRYGR